jgi:hypothetical protein
MLIYKRGHSPEDAASVYLGVKMLQTNRTGPARTTHEYSTQPRRRIIGVTSIYQSTSDLCW